jgi:putative nucleotidyltransferase with HDIG domain
MDNSLLKDIPDSDDFYKEIVEVYAVSINKLKSKEHDLNESREAFFNMLEDITDSYNELENLFITLISTLVNALDAKSEWTRGHSENVAKYTEIIAREMGFEGEKLKNIRLAGLLHDIGKIGTYDYLLNKPGSLTDEEFELVKRHPAQGAAILSSVKQLKEIVPLVKHHHERVDGKGYPDGISGNEIPLAARILHVADSFDAIISDRPYRPSPGIDHAKNELKRHVGTQFDPDVVNTFLNVLDNF